MSSVSLLNHTLKRIYAAMERKPEPEPEPEDQPQNVCNLIRAKLEKATEFGQAFSVVTATVNAVLHLLAKLETPAIRKGEEATDRWKLVKRLVVDGGEISDTKCRNDFLDMAHDKLRQLQEALR